MPPCWMRSSISTTSTLAPPCSGPHKAQTAAAQEANRFARAEPTTRAVDVLQFCSWSAWRMKIRFRASSTSVRDVVLLIRNREHHVQEVRTVAQGGIRIDEGQSQRTPIGIGGDRPHLADQPGGDFLERLVVAQREELRIETGHVAQRRREQGHRRGVGGDVLELVLHALVQQLVPRQPLAEPVQFVLLGQSAENQQPGSLDEVGMFGELLDGDAAIAEDPLVPVDERDRALADGRVRQRRVVGGQSGGVAKAGNVHGLFALRPHKDGKFNLLVAKTKHRFLRHVGLPYGLFGVGRIVNPSYPSGGG